MTTVPPVVSNNTYNIANFGSYTSRVANLTWGNPNAAITCWDLYDDPSSTNLQWNVQNYGTGGNQIIIESVTSPGYYASAYNYSQNVPVVASQTPTIWTVTPVPSGNYRIGAGGYEWYLGGWHDIITILLQPSVDDNTPSEQQWSFQTLQSSSS